MKGVTGNTLWIIISLILGVIAIGLLILFSPKLIEAFTMFAGALFEWMRHLI